MLDTWLHIILAMVGIVVVLFLAYYLTRLYAKKMGTYFGTGQNIKVIDRLPVGKGSSIAVVELKGQQYLLGVTEQNISLIDKLDEQIQPAPVKDLPGIDLSGSFKSLLRKEIGNEGNDNKQQNN